VFPPVTVPAVPLYPLTMLVNAASVAICIEHDARSFCVAVPVNVGVLSDVPAPLDGVVVFMVGDVESVV